MKTCILCKKKFSEYGNNPWPLAEKGECCDDCDDLKVTPARMMQMGVSREAAEAQCKGIHEAKKTFLRRFKKL